MKEGDAIFEKVTGSKNKGMEQRSNKIENTYLPSNLSVSITMGNRMIEPVSIGIPKSQPT